MLFRSEGKETVNRLKKLSKWVVIVPATLILGYIALDRIVLAPKLEEPTLLSWTAPTENENDNPLNDLAGYIVHCWSEAGRFTKTVHVGDPHTSAIELEDFPSGVHYCAITAVNTDGGESALSNVVAKTIP